MYAAPRTESALPQRSQRSRISRATPPLRLKVRQRQVPREDALLSLLIGNGIFV
jgi:hypothetical protein